MSPSAASQEIVGICLLLSGYASSQQGSAAQINSSAAIVISAKQQAASGTVYDPSYVRIKYPGGDVPTDRGACTDLIIRSLRSAGCDLQKLIHQDMKRSPRSYGGRARKLDRNIDHRRCTNQIAFFKRHGQIVTTTANSHTLAQWKPGDIVYWKLDSGLDHTGIISDTMGSSGYPNVIHNLSVCMEEDVLTRWRIVAHFRYPKA